MGVSASANASSTSDELGWGACAGLVLPPGTFIGIFRKCVLLDKIWEIWLVAAALWSVFSSIIEGDGADEAGLGPDPGMLLIDGGTKADAIMVVDFWPANLGTANGFTGLVAAPVDLTANGFRVPSFTGN